MAFTNRYRPDLPAGPIQDAFDALYAQLRGFIKVSFNEDGTLIPATPDAGVSPVGSIIMYGGASAPSNWLMCDGAAVSRVTYKDLFAIIGVTYGTGDGSTTFNTPDMRQRFPLGKAASGTGVTLGSTGGTIDHTHSLSGATFSATTSSDGSHSHSGDTGSASPGTDSAGSHTHTFTTDAPTGVTSIEYNPGGPIQNAASENHYHTGTTDSGGSHSHTVNNHSHSIGSDGSHTHTVSGTISGGTLGTANPPYQVVNYIILAGV